MNEQQTGLQLAVKLLAQIGDDDSDAAIAAVHAACDLAQRVADLEAERDKLQHEHHAVRTDAQARVDAAVIRALSAERERDELRARLAEIEAQEPAKWGVPGFAVVDSLDQVPAKFLPPATIPTPLYARPVPAQAVPDGWRLVPAEPTDEMCVAGGEAVHDAGAGSDDESEADQNAAASIYGAMLAAAPEHKA